ncbi:SGNH/GDSL hydrolase family protein [Paenibacillus odorifer]|uniref:SGNH hydrolase-type esterase domain-containing protein n=1 Tax=Paenibacillus odorifer TaxID=189426 RepID=A0A1R0XAY3_9BACL|nr:SGNH/GDSL hydrolase family protein [Paenibacillus odorifer]OMD32089.1 hypothetical protein BJP51_15960 [Paenibacillus odorifer]
MVRKVVRMPEIFCKRFLQRTVWKSEKITGKLFLNKYSRISEGVIIENKEDSFLFQRLLNKDVDNVKLVGDSLTFGVGVWSYHSRKDTEIIYSSSSEVYRESPRTIHTWSNYLAEYIKRNFPKVHFQNYGIPGKSAKWINANRDQLITDSEDVVIIMAGTNDRWDCQNVDEFKEVLQDLLLFIKVRAKLMYVISPPPVANSEKNLNFGMNDVDAATKDICAKHGFNYISQYDATMDHSRTNNIPLLKMFERHGSHPKEKGYSLMWQIVRKELTLR